jgi:hypothetical protein
MKPSKDFRMSKQTKRFMALLPFKTQEERGSFKRGMIDAQLTEEKTKKESQRGKPKDE